MLRRKCIWTTSVIVVIQKIFFVWTMLLRTFIYPLPLIKSKSLQFRLLTTFEKACTYRQDNNERLKVLRKVHLFVLQFITWKMCPNLSFLQVYSPLLIHEEGSPEWNKLAKSGKVWEDYFRPFEWRAQDYGMIISYNL